MTHADITLEQLGGASVLRRLLGAQVQRDKTGNILYVEFPNRSRRINLVEIEYVPGRDTYDVRIGYVSLRVPKKVKHSFDDIYGDQLVDICERYTGLSWRMPRIVWR